MHWSLSAKILHNLKKLREDFSCIYICKHCHDTSLCTLVNKDKAHIKWFFLLKIHKIQTRWKQETAYSSKSKSDHNSHSSHGTFYTFLMSERPLASSTVKVWGYTEIFPVIVLTCDLKLKIALVMLLSSRDLQITQALVDERYVNIKNGCALQTLSSARLM